MQINLFFLLKKVRKFFLIKQDVQEKKLAQRAPPHPSFASHLVAKNFALNTLHNSNEEAKKKFKLNFANF